MIVVAIIGILAAIAIPNFLRYQLRAKASELKENVNAIFKAEEALKNREQGSGQYTVFGAGLKLLPATPCATGPGSSKLAWAPTDLSSAQAIDWMVEGSTYGCYNVAIPAAAPFIHLTVWAESDIDADGILNCVYLYKATLASAGTAATNATGVDAGCKVTTGLVTFAQTGQGTAGGLGWGQVTQLDPNVF
jgi:type IV pilus assembly protein PilA